MRVAVTGKEGQLARSLLLVGAQKGIDVVTIGRPEFNLLAPKSVFSSLRALRPDVIISAAAYTAVERAELEPDLAYSTNSIGAEAVAKAATELGVPLIHLSTDYVFKGDKALPYVETDPTDPMSVYGRTKLESEIRVAAACENHIILRTAWVYSQFGHNFMNTMLDLAATHNEVRVVGDQVGCPTSSVALAEAILNIAHIAISDIRSGLNGVFHITGRGQATWAEFAEEIFFQSRELGGPHANVLAITSQDYPSLVSRPMNSRLSGKKLTDIYGITLPEWKTSLVEVLRQRQRN